MNLAFSPKFLADVRNQARVLLKRSCTLSKLVNTQIKGITLLCSGKNNICISCFSNGFKYIFNLTSFTKSIVPIAFSGNLARSVSVLHFNMNFQLNKTLNLKQSHNQSKFKYSYSNTGQKTQRVLNVFVLSKN